MVASELGVAKNFIAANTVFNPGLGIEFFDRLRSFAFALKVRGFSSGSCNETGIR